MARFRISYTYYTLDAKGKRGGGSSTQSTVEATSDVAAMSIIMSKHRGKDIEWRKIIQV
jgi:hypothetical protein